MWMYFWLASFGFACCIVVGFELLRNILLRRRELEKFPLRTITIGEPPPLSCVWRPIEQAGAALKHGARADIWLVPHDIPDGLRYPGAIWSAQMHCFVDSLRSPVALSDATHFMVVEGPKQWKS